MYSLLNYISATSKESYEGSWNSPHTSINASTTQSQEHHVQSLKSGLQAFNEDQQRLIGISTISVVACLATEFRIDEVSEILNIRYPLFFIFFLKKKVTRLTVSMLLQRLRSAEPTVEAAIVYNLVDLAIISPLPTFKDIIKAFSVINRSANREDPRFSNNTVRMLD